MSESEQTPSDDAQFDDHLSDEEREQLEARAAQMDYDEQQVEEQFDPDYFTRFTDDVIVRLAAEYRDRDTTDVTAIYGPHHEGGVEYGYSVEAFRFEYGDAVVIAQRGVGDRTVYTGDVRHVYTALERLIGMGWTVEQADFTLRLDD